MTIPDLDQLPEYPLGDFYRKYRNPKLTDAKELVGERPGYLRVTKQLASYAHFRLQAIERKRCGAGDSWMTSLEHCEEIYRQLPEDLQFRENPLTMKSFVDSIPR